MTKTNNIYVSALTCGDEVCTGFTLSPPHRKLTFCEKYGLYMAAYILGHICAIIILIVINYS